MKTDYKQQSYKLRKLELVLSQARKGLLLDNSEEGVLKEIKDYLKIWDSFKAVKE